MLEKTTRQVFTITLPDFLTVAVIVTVKEKKSCDVFKEHLQLTTPPGKLLYVVLPDGTSCIGMLSCENQLIRMWNGVSALTEGIQCSHPSRATFEREFTRVAV